MIIQVAVPGPFYAPLDYRVEAELSASAESWIGCRVRVPFRNREQVGVVLAMPADSEYDADKLKTVLERLDDTPLLDSQHLAFLQWAADYYQAPIGDLIQIALPKRLRSGEPALVNGVPAWQLSDLGRQSSVDSLPKNAKQQRALFEYLAQMTEPVSSTHLNQALSNWRPSLKKLLEKQWVSEELGSCLPKPYFAPLHELQLNDEQQMAASTVINQLSEGFRSYLLEGITGSGKTEVYLEMIQAVIQQGQQVLVLVPEIGLTPQMVTRFQNRLQQTVAMLHSGMNDSERHCAWQAVRSGEAAVLLGTRSAVFAPFKNLGLCIIDEEHDLSFKQQDGIRYSARDLLIRRAFQWQIPVVLGSATPSLESLANVAAGRSTRLALTQRAANAIPPKIRLLDVRGEKVQAGVSTPLKTAMQSHLETGGQVLLFLNRRGFAPVLMCHNCGWQAQCPSCDANMTLHQTKHAHLSDYLKCHHCGFQAEAPQACPSCLQKEFVKIGQGTERLAETIAEWFPDYKVLRIDRDTTRAKGSMKTMTEQARSGEADILIGTQMLAKGHHFPNVTLVGLIDIDQGLFSGDFRAPERMAQLVLQVAGRAGRAEKSGEVLIQTHHPDHAMFKALIQHGYGIYAENALAERQQAKLPPYQYQLMVRAEASQGDLAWAFLNQLKQWLQTVQTENSLPSVSLWGPVSAPMERRQGRYRYQLLLQAGQRSALHQLWQIARPEVLAHPLSRKVRWSLDIDPQEMN